MNSFARSIMEHKYAHDLENGKETWEQIAYRATKHPLRAVGITMRDKLAKDLCRYITDKKFLPGGRYLYAAGRPFHQVQNCLLLRAVDSREGWAELLHNASMALMTGAGIGIDYSDVRHKGSRIRKTGGMATGPIALMQMLNECGRGIMQGGSRRCLPGKTLITMSDFSKKKIADIEIGDMVQTRFGPKKVTNVFDQGRQEILEFTTEHGIVYSSRNHKWLCSNASRTKTFCVPAERLSLSCKLHYHPCPKPGGKETCISWAYVLGYFLGDGCAYSSNRTHEVTFQVAHRKYNQRQVKFIQDVMRSLGCNPVSRKGHGNVTEIRCRSKKLVSKFQEYKMPNRPFSIPKEILEANFDAKCAFVAGWFDADGSYSDSWKLYNEWESVRKEIVDFLFGLGFIFTFNGNEVRLCDYQRPNWRNYIMRYAFKRAKGHNGEKSSSEVPSDIKNIKSIGIKHTYDIEVEGAHEFIADDFVSHNSAIWAGLSWKHGDVHEFIRIKNWSNDIRAFKEKDFNFPATLDQTNISVVLDDEFFEAYKNAEHDLHPHAHSVYWAVINQMLETGEPGFSVDVGRNSGETLRNACGEITSCDDSDICNLGSINLARIENSEEMRNVVEAATAYLLAGTVYSDVPYSKVDQIRTKNRRLGLGVLGVHEWLLKRDKRYGPDAELEEWLKEYADSGIYAKRWAKEWDLSIPKKTRAIAPTGTIGIMAETTTGIEPIFCVAFKRRYLKGNQWYFQYVIDPTAKNLVSSGIDHSTIEDAYSLTPKRRIEFQAWMQQFVDHGISSTINLPAWGSEKNNSGLVMQFGNMLLKHLPNLRGITAYPDGARGGQPLVPCSYDEAIQHEGSELIEESVCVCDLRGGSCGE